MNREQSTFQSGSIVENRQNKVGNEPSEINWYSDDNDPFSIGFDNDPKGMHYKTGKKKFMKIDLQKWLHKTDEQGFLNRENELLQKVLSIVSIVFVLGLFAYLFFAFETSAS